MNVPSRSRLSPRAHAVLDEMLAPLPDESMRLLEAAGVTVNGRRTPGQQLADRGKTKTRGGRDADFESAHPRGRGGEWTVKAGAHGSAVRRIQSRVGGTKADGIFGARTVAAVRAFQARHGLQVDGLVGAQTVAAMRGAKDAKDVKPGSLTEADRRYLSGEKSAARRRGRSRQDGGALRETPSELEPLELSEVVADGGAVSARDYAAAQHAMTERLGGVTAEPRPRGIDLRRTRHALGLTEATPAASSGYRPFSASKPAASPSAQPASVSSGEPAWAAVLRRKGIASPEVIASMGYRG